MQIGNSRYILKLMILGAVSFWSPDALWHAVRRCEFGQWWADTLVLTLVMPLTRTRPATAGKVFQRWSGLP
jgi:hypothetical protein